MVSKNGKSYDTLVGTRAQVWHGTAYKTSGGLTRKHLVQNKHGRIVSRAKQATARKEKRLLKAGYGTKKGKFGFVRIGKAKKSRSRKMRGGMMALSPADFDGRGVQTSGNAVQIAAGMGN